MEKVLHVFFIYLGCIFEDQARICLKTSQNSLKISSDGICVIYTFFPNNFLYLDLVGSNKANAIADTFFSSSRIQSILSNHTSNNLPITCERTRVTVTLSDKIMSDKIFVIND